jgi:hypothetical protein
MTDTTGDLLGKANRMAEKLIDNMTLREVFISTETLVRDLDDHLRNSFRSKLKAARDLVQTHAATGDPDDISDGTVRQHNAAILASDDYAQDLIKNLSQHLSAIQVRSQQALHAK